MLFDTHLVNVALAGLGISAGIAVLIAATIIAVAAVQLRRTSSGRKLTPVSVPATTVGTALEREPQAA
jgi:predicted membrane channel-forming protein YqfA (hemolysin III family)